MQTAQLAYQGRQFQLDTYWLDPIRDFQYPVKHPVAIICPGGRFTFQTDREAQPIALKFAAEGMHAIVFHYQLIEDQHSVYPRALQELAVVLNWLQTQAQVHQIDLNKVVLVGFSAGAHVVANFNGLMLDETQRGLIFADKLLVEPAANVLCYPVIDLTAGYPKTAAAREQISSDPVYWQAQNQLNSNSKPTFLWQTVADQTVPVQNSLLYAQQMNQLQLPYELHLFAAGSHGLALGNYVTQTPGRADHLNYNVSFWWELCLNWLKLLEILPAS